MKRVITIAGLALALAAPGAAHADVAFTLAAGADYRWAEQSWYFYGSPTSGYSDSTAALPAASLEAMLRFPVSERAFVGGGAAFSIGSGNVEFTTPGPTTRDESATLYHAAAFGEAGFGLTPWLTALGRVGIGFTEVSMDPAGEGSVDLLVAGGLAIQVSQRLGLGVLYELSAANLSAWTDAGITSADPSLRSRYGAALQARLFFGF